MNVERSRVDDRRPTTGDRSGAGSALPLQPSAFSLQPSANRKSFLFQLSTLVLVFVAFRLFAPVVLKPVGYFADWNDYYFFEGWARFTDRGLYPYLDFWMEHPPLFPWLVVVAYRLSALIPAWHDPHLAFSLVFGSVLLLFDIGNLVLISRIAASGGGPAAGLRAAWIYTLLFAPVFFWTAGFEAYPLFFMLLGLKLAIGDKRSAISDQRQAISHQRSAISDQRDGGNLSRVPGTGYPQGVVWRHFPAAEREPDAGGSASIDDPAAGAIPRPTPSRSGDRSYRGRSSVVGGQSGDRSYGEDRSERDNPFNPFPKSVDGSSRGDQAVEGDQTVRGDQPVAPTGPSTFNVQPSTQVQPSAFSLQHSSSQSSAFRLRPFLAGLAIGVGIMVKLVPALVLPAGVFALWRAGRTRAAVLLVAVTFATAGLIALPFVVANPTMAQASATSLLTRSSWETVWALAEGYYSGGTVAKPETRLDPATASIVERPATVPALPILAVAGLIGLMVLWKARDWRRPQAVVAALGLTVVLFLLAAKGYSPQFLVYLLAPIVLLWPNRRGVGFALVLSVINLFEYPVALLLFADWPAALVTAVLLRTAVLVVLGIEFSLVLLARPMAIGGRVGTALATGVVVVIGLVSAAGISAYASGRAAADPAAEAIQLLRSRSNAGALFSDAALFDRLTPLLRDRVPTRLVRTGVPPRLPENSTEIWHVFIDSAEGRQLAPAVRSALLASAFSVDSRTVAGLRLDRWIQADPPFRSVSGDLGSVRLTGAAISSEVRPGADLPVELRWEVGGTPGSDLKVFLHVLDGSGRLVAQRDAPPAEPTVSWRPGSTVTDRHAIVLPRELPNGEYRVRVGLYDPVTGQRLQGSSGDAVDLGTIAVRN